MHNTLFIIVENIEMVCNNCQCGGQPEIDYEDLGNANGGADECFGIAKTNKFCGSMIIIDLGNGRCYCRGIGKESSCSKEPVPGNNWSVYQSGKQPYANKKSLLLYLLKNLHWFNIAIIDISFKPRQWWIGYYQFKSDIR